LLRKQPRNFRGLLYFPAPCTCRQQHRSHLRAVSWLSPRPTCMSAALNKFIWSFYIRLYSLSYNDWNK